MQNFFPDEGSKIAVAMSGGVDSSVAAKILVEKGYKVVGFWMWLDDKLSSDTNFGMRFQTRPDNRRGSNSEMLSKIVSSLTSFRRKGIKLGFEEAQSTATLLKIPLYILDLREDFRRRVIDEFVAAYERGETPNPCVICNRAIKFGAAWEFAKKRLGAKYLATGHYARVASINEKCKVKSVKLYTKKCLITAKDQRKDQSYFLYAINNKIIDKLVFPIGDYFKEEVRAMARKWKLPAAKSKDSQNICFAPDVVKFWRNNIKNQTKKGEVLDTKNNQLGTHHGLVFYTAGQRAGFEMNRKLKTARTPKNYVVAKDIKHNQLIVGSQQDASSQKFWITDVNWLEEPETNFFEAWVRIRSTGQMLRGKVCRGPAARSSRPMASLASSLQALDGTPSACVTPLGTKTKPKHYNNDWQIILSRPELGVAPGQAAVIYKKLKIKNEKLMILIGGGRIIQNFEP